MREDRLVISGFSVDQDEIERVSDVDRLSEKDQDEGIFQHEGKGQRGHRLMGESAKSDVFCCCVSSLCP